MTALGLLTAAVSLLASARTEIHFEKLSFEEALEMAREQDKYLFIDIMATWCGPCKMMERDVFTDAQVAQYMNANYIAIQIDVDDTEDGPLLQELRVESIPTLAFYSPDGVLAVKEEGSIGASAFLRLAKDAKDWEAPSEPVTDLSTVAKKRRYLQTLSAKDAAKAHDLATAYVQERIQQDALLRGATGEDWGIITDYVGKDISEVDVSVTPIADDIDRHLMENIELILDLHYANAYAYYDKAFDYMLFYMMETKDPSHMDFYNEANGVFQWINNEKTLPQKAFHEFNWMIYHYLTDNHDYFAANCGKWLHDYFEESADQHLRFVGMLLNDCTDATCASTAKQVLATAVAIGLDGDEQKEMATAYSEYIDSLE